MPVSQPSITSTVTWKRAIARRRALIAALHEAGAGLLPGSDSPQIFNVPGFAIHRELDRMLDRFRRDDPLPGL